MAKSVKFSNFIRRNAYYLAFIFCLSLLVFITVALVITANSDNVLDAGGNQIEDGGSGNQNDQTGGNGGDNTPSGGENPSDTPSKPTDVIVFDMPVANATIIKDYVDASVVYNQTLGLYTGHKAIDFGAQEGAEVTCVYDGIIESIEISKVYGTTIVVDHLNGLKTLYNSLEASEHLQEGMSVLKGEVLGEVSLNNKTEHLDGAHLHFEVYENGIKIDPNKYLISDDK
jgi:murein DD-endopeptidase MepM/ murein hydrolase activator NlpD